MRHTAIFAALALAGCASTYELQLMPRDSGRIYTGTAQDSDRGEGPISITIEGKTYNGTWTETQPSTTTGCSDIAASTAVCEWNSAGKEILKRTCSIT